MTAGCRAGPSSRRVGRGRTVEFRARRWMLFFRSGRLGHGPTPARPTAELPSALHNAAARPMPGSRPSGVAWFACADLRGQRPPQVHGRKPAGLHQPGHAIGACQHARGQSQGHGHGWRAHHDRDRLRWRHLHGGFAYRPRDLGGVRRDHGDRAVFRGRRADQHRLRYPGLIQSGLDLALAFATGGRERFS